MMDFEGAKTYILDRMKRGLAPNLYYHGLHHTLDVYAACERYAEMEEVKGDDRLILLTAALFHDAGFLIRYKANEEVSVDIVRRILPNYGYSKTEITLINQSILSTVIPQTPYDKISSILCDADLDYLGRDDFFIIGCNLRREWKEYGIELSIKDWYEQQVHFLTNHHYFTRSADFLRSEKKLKHLYYLDNLVKKHKKMSLLFINLQMKK
ncbi:MAG: HD domain-containing protein [Bacteroidales bacterium]|nr:HD domain-containing protein [Bacteroidales bacterium]